MEEQPSLIFSGQEIPLIKISKNKFKFRKNSEALRVISGSENVSDFRFVEPQKKIESFCFVTTFEIKIEASILLYTLRQHHDEPIYILTDQETKDYLDKFNFGGVNYLIGAQDNDLSAAKKEIGDRFKNIHTLHRPECILKKMDVMDWALSLHSNTFFLDSDIIVLQNLQENFSSNLCLSPHFHTNPSIDDIAGIYNAGYIFCADKNFPNWWRKQFLESGTFYEQECLNRAEVEFGSQAFDKTHNIGFWRDGINLEGAKSVHLHLSQGAENKIIGPSKEKHQKLKEEFLKTVNIPFINNEINKEKLFGRKLAFVHFGKTGGVYLNHYLRTFVFDELEDKNQWRQKHNGEIKEARDWSKKELLSFLEDAHDNILVHNHHNNWNASILEEYKKRRWFSFMFLRHPCDLLCSLYFFSRQNIKNTGVSAINPNGVLAGYQDETAFKELDVFKLSLDEFIVQMVDNPAQHLFWALPDYIEELDWAAEMNDDNLSEFFLRNFNHQYIPRKKINSSDNLGYLHYLNGGQISKKTYTLLMDHPEGKRYEKYLKV